MKLKILPQTLSVSRFAPHERIPTWALHGEFCSITRTIEELSIVCDESHAPADAKAERNWHAIQVEGPLDFGLTGILASIANPLAAAKISIFAISTFDTDYVLVKAPQLELARAALEQAGFTFR